MKEVKAYVCSYCGYGPSCNPDLMLEHEKRCNRNPDKQYCSCVLCAHGKNYHREDTGYQHRKITRTYTVCTVGEKFDYLYNYCPKFELKKSEEE